MLDLLISLGLWGGIRQLRDVLVIWLDGFVLRRFGLQCPVCLSKHIWKDGHEKRKCRCPVQRYICCECSRRFCINTLAPWYWHKYPSASIIYFLWEILRGESTLSLRKRISFLKRLPSWNTLWRWQKKFGTLLLVSYAKHMPIVSRYRAWQTDEVYLLKKPVIGTIDPQTNQIFLTPEDNTKKETMYRHMRRVVTRWKKKPRGWWTDEHASYPPALSLLPEYVPHGTVKHKTWQFKNCRNQTTNAIENTWRQLRRWLNRKNGLNKLKYRELHIGLFQAAYTNVKTPLQMIELLLR